jgi:hypothetical protein
MQCRAYRRASSAYKEGKPTSEQTELLTKVDRWRREDEEH